jgi:hypothetical protein
VMPLAEFAEVTPADQVGDIPLHGGLTGVAAHSGDPVERDIEDTSEPVSMGAHGEEDIAMIGGRGLAVPDPIDHPGGWRKALEIEGTFIRLSPSLFTLSFRWHSPRSSFSPRPQASG